ncbi:hypothetical protein SRABI96_02031 [Peribacillus sp. Bi96]|uniref:amidase domain-containing protein n=1 Tax=unclassified Peribacillus TaxID=2675266 RepID=UPI001DF9845B|nr:amidase domain-containing protein [Peribacillus sp. Bi96]CAH0205228.1 hypothetical protein SRABI96_02031 [Peribacillus sp. Bi96]
MKKIAFYMFSFTLFIGFFLYQDSASATEKVRNDYTFGEVETILVDYLNEKGYNLEVGTEEYINFVVEQMNNDSDKELANREDYQLICAYFAEYLHRLTLEETQNYDQGLDNTIDTATFELSDEVKDTTLGEMKDEIQQEEAVKELEKIISIVPTATGTINLTNARSYAKKYYSSYNTSYPKYSNDCTNFVSQILFAGGRKKVGTTTATLVSDTKSWFIMKRPDNTFSRSTSWTVVTDLYSHLVRTQVGYSSTSKSSIIKNAKSGDVIQFKKSGADRYSHAMWIYEKQSSNLLLSGHTSNYWNRSFNAITGYSSYRIVKM